MKKTIFIAIALSLLLCTNAFPGNMDTRVYGQKIILNNHLHTYPTEQFIQTRAYFRNNNHNPIMVNSIKFYDPNGNVVNFCVSNGICEELITLKLGLTPPLVLGPYASNSLSMGVADFGDASWIPPTISGGGLGFYLIEWSATYRSLPLDVWALRFTIYDNIRYSFDSWKGVVIEEKMGYPVH